MEINAIGTKQLKVSHQYPSVRGGYENYRSVAEITFYDDHSDPRFAAKDITISEKLQEGGLECTIGLRDTGDHYVVHLQNGHSFKIEYADMELISLALNLLERETFPTRARKIKVLSEKVLDK